MSKGILCQGETSSWDSGMISRTPGWRAMVEGDKKFPSTIFFHTQ